VLRVGGPATNSPVVWLTDFLNFTRSTGTPFDFVSSHDYGGSRTIAGDAEKVVSGLQSARAILGPDITYLVTEYGSTATQGIGQPSDPIAAAYHDTVNQAAFVAAVVSKTSL